MKKLVFTTLLCGGVAQSLAGCIIVSDDDPDPPRTQPDAGQPAPDAAPLPGPGEFLVSWYLVAGDAEEPVDCPPGASYVNVSADPDPAVADDELVYKYDCIDGEGPAYDLDAGIYDVWVELYDENDNLVAKSDVSAENSLDLDEQVLLDFTFSVDRARFGLSWQIAYPDGTPSSCEEAGGETISVLSTLADDSGTGFDQEFDCSLGDDVTDPMPLGPYVVVTYLIDDDAPPGDDVLGESLDRNEELVYGNEIKDLGVFVFELVE